MAAIPEELFKKLIHNECSEDEIEEILSNLADADQQSVYDDLILAQLARKVNLDNFPEQVKLRLNHRFQDILKEDELREQGNLNDRSATAKIKKLPFPAWIKLSAVAAAVLGILSVGMLEYRHQWLFHKVNRLKTAVSDIAPGKNDAVLTLSDGRKIVLTEKGNGELAEQAGIKITKAADGKLVYHIEDAGDLESGSASLYNTITTPKGGQYQVNLPDGTKVWLNSASSIKFPIVFTKAATRKVELSGEGYFEVAKDKNHPFIVQTLQQSVQVLGTHFDISSYAEDRSTKTTLLEGAVSITANHQTSVLKPGQQADVSTVIHISEVDTENAVAWKNGYFLFDDEELESVMNKIARWYDVEIVYNDDQLKHELFAAYTTRFANVSQLLKRMNLMGNARFELVGRKIIVSGKMIPKP